MTNAFSSDVDWLYKFYEHNDVSNILSVVVQRIQRSWKAKNNYKGLPFP